MTDYVWGKIDDIGKSFGRYAVLTQEVPWNLVKERVGGEAVAVKMVDSLERARLDSLIREIPQVDTIVGIGGGVCIDNAKYFAWKRKCSAAYVPTILSVNAYATPAAAIRDNGVVTYEGLVEPETIVIDYGAIQSAPKRLNTAGTGDIYSCETALFDWKLAHEKTGEFYDEKIAARSRGLVVKLVANSNEVKNVSEKGIKTLVELHVETNTLQQAAKTPRPEEGSEHVFFYSLEEKTGRGFLHGEVVGTGIFVVRHFQANDEERVALVMEGFGLLFRPKEYQVKKDEFVSALEHMKTYASYKEYKEKLPYTILDEVDITRDDVDALWTALT